MKCCAARGYPGAAFSNSSNRDIARLGSAAAPRIAHALETKARTPVIWLHGLECTCCSESFIRSSASADQGCRAFDALTRYDDTLMAGRGHQAEAIIEEVKKKYRAITSSPSKAIRRSTRTACSAFTAAGRC